MDRVFFPRALRATAVVRYGDQRGEDAGFGSLRHSDSLHTRRRLLCSRSGHAITVTDEKNRAVSAGNVSRYLFLFDEATRGIAQSNGSTVRDLALDDLAGFHRSSIIGPVQVTGDGDQRAPQRNAGKCTFPARI